MAKNTLTIRDKRTEKRFFVDNLFVDQYGPIVGPYGHAVYNVLIRHSTPEGRGSWPSHATIAKKAGCGAAKVKQVLKQFEELGLVAVRKRFNKKTQAQTSNEYIILDPPPLEQAPLLEDTQAGHEPDTPPQVSQKATINPPSDQSSLINPPKNGSPEKPKPEKKPDILDAIAHFSGLSEEDNWAVPAAAGGADDWAVAVDAFAALKGINPNTMPGSTRREWSKVLHEIGTEWSAGPLEMSEVIEKVPKSEFDWKTYSSPHSARDDLGILIGQKRDGGIKPSKKKGNGGVQRRNMELMDKLLAEEEAKKNGEPRDDGACIEGVFTVLDHGVVL